MEHPFSKKPKKPRKYVIFKTLQRFLMVSKIFFKLFNFQSKLKVRFVV